MKILCIQDDRINKWIQNHIDDAHLIRVKSDYDAIKLLSESDSADILGAILDRMNALHIMQNHFDKFDFMEYKIKNDIPAYYMLSKTKFTNEDLNNMNNRLEKYLSTKDYYDLSHSYMYPVLLTHITTSWWLETSNMMGLIAFIISGIIIAYYTKATLFVTFLSSLLPVCWEAK